MRLIAARSLLNYKLTGQEVPREDTVLPCAHCKTKVAVSPSGMALLQKYADTVALVCCPCATAAAARADALVKVGASPHAVRQLETSEGARQTMALFLEAARRKGKRNPQ